MVLGQTRGSTWRFQGLLGQRLALAGRLAGLESLDVAALMISCLAFSPVVFRQLTQRPTLPEAHQRRRRTGAVACLLAGHLRIRVSAPSTSWGWPAYLPHLPFSAELHPLRRHPHLATFGSRDLALRSGLMLIERHFDSIQLFVFRRQDPISWSPHSYHPGRSVFMLQRSRIDLQLSGRRTLAEG